MARRLHGLYRRPRLWPIYNVVVLKFPGGCAKLGNEPDLIPWSPRFQILERWKRREDVGTGVWVRRGTANRERGGESWESREAYEKREAESRWGKRRDEGSVSQCARSREASRHRGGRVSEPDDLGFHVRHYIHSVSGCPWETHQQSFQAHSPKA